MKKLHCLFIFALILSAPALAAAETLHVAKAKTAPEIDGSADGVWDSAPAVKISVARIPEEIIAVNKEKQTGKYAGNWQKDKYTKDNEVELKALYTDDEIFFLARWKDDTMDDKQKPWVWNADKGEYETSKQTEDRLAFRFPISGEFTANMLSGVESVVDAWQWKAARTNRGDYIHDKSHAYSNAEPKGKFSSHYTADGAVTYVVRSSDGGAEPYKANNIDPFTNQGDKVPGYFPEVPADPDAKDVKAKGVWKDGYWTVEIGRKLDTGHKATDAVFDPSKGTKLSVAVFDRSGDHFHAVSGIVEVLFDN